ncbi:serine/arginine-rich splicing factor RS40 isoform X1 [Rhododendron vialii]|uniref:serine/arginine-rich splicing factor RS40 isoform X1 n=1 Tax=Rhododendron vialii TaxID=182163 RepID=UPI00265FE625|nr:serine/arginine-rich splicing factor RS40 isoform X1 [Rhododendron vialii]XP_058205060.1 serine/arginine-rich splicing factor RS40 isoform X1 [Rhododendron vialii]
MSIHFLTDRWASSAFHFLAVTSFLFLFPRRATLTSQSHTILRHQCISCLMNLAQPSFSDTFPGRNHATLNAEASEYMEKALFSLSYHETSTFPFLFLDIIYFITQGFAFVYMEDDRDAEDAIRGLDRYEYGRKGRRLRVEWTKQERVTRRPESAKKSSTNSRPSKTLFVINFDPYHTRTRDLERHFDPYGKILNVRIRRNFAFIQYESQEDATKAIEATNMSKLMDRVISVEYAVKDDDDRRNGHSPDRGRDRSPGRRGHERGRSPSPVRRERASPDYGRGRSPSPRRERGSPDYGRGHSRSPPRKERTNSDYGRSRSSRSPRRERPSPDHVREPSPREGRVTPDHGRGSPSPPRERISPDDYPRGRNPDSKHEPRESPKYEEGESPGDERYQSRSPPARERERSRS